MQNYLDLHRHAAVRAELLNHQGIALRLAVAQVIAGSSLWMVHADPQRANTDAIKDSLITNLAEDLFAQERKAIRDLLSVSDVPEDTFVLRKDDWGKSHDLQTIFGKLLEMDDAIITRILTFVVAETLPCGSDMVEQLGSQLEVDMNDYHKPSDLFFDLLRDKEAINQMVKEVAGKPAAEGNITATAKVQKQIIQNCLTGERKAKVDINTWQPRYMDFPMKGYTKRQNTIAAVSRA